MPRSREFHLAQTVFLFVLLMPRSWAQNDHDSEDKVDRDANKLTLTIDEEVIYYSAACPQSIHVSCKKPDGFCFSRYIEVYLLTSLSTRTERVLPSGRKKVISHVVTQEEHASQMTTELHEEYTISTFVVPIKDTGRLTIQCITIPNPYSCNGTYSKTVEIKASSMTPTISMTPKGITTQRGGQYAQTGQFVNMKCVAPWRQDDALRMELTCDSTSDNSTVAISDNQTSLMIPTSSFINGTTCTCNMRLSECPYVGVSRMQFFTVEQRSCIGGPNPDIKQVKEDTDTDSSPNTTVIGLAVGLTLATFFVATVFFFVGIKVGEKRMRKKSKTEIPCGAPRSNDVTGARCDDLYSHIDPLYTGESDHYETTLGQDSKETIPKRPLPVQGNQNKGDNSVQHQQQQQQHRQEQQHLSEVDNYYEQPTALYHNASTSEPPTESVYETMYKGPAQKCAIL